MTFGLSPLGFRAKRLADLKQDLENAFIAEFGDINIAPQSVFGQIIGVMAKPLADVWENLQDVYLSQYPNSAEGAALDNVVQYNGLTRTPAARTAVTVIVSGNESTLIPAGSLVRIPNTNNVFFNPADGIITSENAYSVSIRVLALAAQVYTVIINNQAFIFSLPLMTLTGSFVSGDVITVTLNGRQLNPVAFVTDSPVTNAAVAAEINAQPEVDVAGTPDGSHIEITPNVGFSVTINSIQITGTPGTSYAVTYSVPSSLAQVATFLAGVIDSGPQPVDSVSSIDTFTVTAQDADVPFSASVQPNLQITAQSSPIPFLSQDFGPIPAPAGSVTEILSPVGGWSTATNPKAGATGRLIETDAELRVRRANSIRLLGNATVEAIRARVLQNVPGIVDVLVFENDDMIQSTIDIVFSAPLITGNQVTITINGRILATITYATSNLATMTQLALLLAAQPEIASAEVAGGSNNILRLNMNIFQEVTIDDVAISGGASQANWVTKGGRPPKSFEVVADGGTDADVAEEIWLSKPAGIQTFGNTNFTITDSQGGSQVIFFSRPTPIYIWVQVTLTLYAEENFPANGLQLVQAAILEYGQNLGIGVDVLLQRVVCQIFVVPGVASGTMLLAATNGPNDTPTYAASDIVIEENEISTWAAERIAVTI